MSDHNDVAGSDDVISLNYESQETFNEHSYRTKQSANRFEKNLTNQAKENQKPIEQVAGDEGDIMRADTQNYSLSTENNAVSDEQVPTSNNTIRPTVVQSTLTDGSSISVDKDSLPMESPSPDETNVDMESTAKQKQDSNTAGFETSTTTNNLRLYISPSSSLLEVTNVDDAQSNPDNISTTEAQEKSLQPDLDDRPKDEPMDTSDAQVSLGSDGIIESHPTSALMIESTSTIEKSSTTTTTTTTTTGQSPTQPKILISPCPKAFYALSQPTTDKFEQILAKVTGSPVRQVAPTNADKTDSSVTIREEEELFIKESVSKIVRRYAVGVDSKGRTLSRELLLERVVEENITTRIESWPPLEKTVRRSYIKTNRSADIATKKPTKPITAKRRTKSLKPTSAVISPKASKVVQSDNDEVSKGHTNEDSSDDGNDKEEEEEEDDAPTDNISGDEFIPTPKKSTGKSLTKDSRVFAKWVDGNFYPGIIGKIYGDKYMIDFDDGAKRYVKSPEIISQSYLKANQKVTVQTQDGYFDRGIIKRIIKKKKTGKLGYIVDKNGKEKWYPLRFISLTTEQAEHLPIANKTTEEPTNPASSKRKRVSNVPQSPNKKTKSSIFISPNKSQRTTFTPTRQTKLFNSMYFLFTGFNDCMDTRTKLQDSIESHGGRMLEKLPNASRRINVYLISDAARKTAKFLEAKKSNIPCVKYDWINESIEKGDVQDWETYKLLLPGKESKKTIDDDTED